MNPPKADKDGALAALLSSVYVGLGSNLGDRRANLRLAIERMPSAGLVVVRESSIYESEPVGFTDQGWFLNQVVEARLNENATTISEDHAASLGHRLVDVLAGLLEIEHQMGRRRERPNGPRPIDLDILLCGGLSGVFHARAADSQGANRAALIELILPHPRMHLRRFVLQPLCEIAPDIVHPRLMKTCAELLAHLNDPSIVRIRQAEDPAGTGGQAEG